MERETQGSKNKVTPQLRRKRLKGDGHICSRTRDSSCRTAQDKLAHTADRTLSRSPPLHVTLAKRATRSREGTQGRSTRAQKKWSVADGVRYRFLVLPRFTIM